MFTLHQYLAYILINNQVNHLFHIGIVILQLLQVFFLIVNFDQVAVIRDVLVLAVIDKTALNSFFFVIEVTIVVLAVAGFLMFRRSDKNTMKNKKFAFVLVTKIYSYIIVLFSTVLLLPVTYCVFSTFSSSTNNT